MCGRRRGLRDIIYANELLPACILEKRETTGVGAGSMRGGTLIATTPMDIREMCLPSLLPSLPAIRVIFYLLHLFTNITKDTKEEEEEPFQ